MTRADVHGAMERLWSQIAAASPPEWIIVNGVFHDLTREALAKQARQFTPAGLADLFPALRKAQNGSRPARRPHHSGP